MEKSTTTIETSSRRAAATLAAFVMLTKPRIIELLLITTVPAMVLAKGGMPRLSLVVLTVVGGALGAGGANAFNMYIDRDIDQLMQRTQGRPLVTGAVSPKAALIFAFALEIAALKRVRQTVSSIEGDSIAKKELKGRLTAYQNMLFNSLYLNFENDKS